MQGERGDGFKEIVQMVEKKKKRIKNCDFDFRERQKERRWLKE